MSTSLALSSHNHTRISQLTEAHLDELLRRRIARQDAAVRRTAYLHPTDSTAALALCMSRRTFVLACSRTGIESPNQRRARRREQTYYKEATR